MRMIQTLTASAAILLALAGPSLAAQRTHRGVDAYASGAATTDRSGPYYFGPQGAQNAPDRIFVRPQYNNQYSPGQNLPYPDRPYGDPDRD
jgi:hypothetical protein